MGSKILTRVSYPTIKWNSVSGGKITFKAVTLSIYLPWLDTPTENFGRSSAYLLSVKSLAASGKPNTVLSTFAFARRRSNSSSWYLAIVSSIILVCASVKGLKEPEKMPSFLPRSDIDGAARCTSSICGNAVGSNRLKSSVYRS